MQQIDQDLPGVQWRTTQMMRQQIAHQELALLLGGGICVIARFHVDQGSPTHDGHGIAGQSLARPTLRINHVEQIGRSGRTRSALRG